MCFGYGASSATTPSLTSTGSERAMRFMGAFGHSSASWLRMPETAERRGIRSERRSRSANRPLTSGSLGEGDLAGIAIVGAATIVCLLALAVSTSLLCRRVLRHGGQFEAEVRALTLAFRVSASRREV